MPEDNIKDYTINWIVLGLLMFCLLSFAIAFMYSNNPIGFGGNETADKFLSVQTGVNTQIYAIEGSADTVLNITANTNPEASQLGSRDSVAAAYQVQGTSVGVWDSLKVFISWIFVGELGKMLITVITGIVGFTGAYFIVKWIRTGL